MFKNNRETIQVKISNLPASCRRRIGTTAVIFGLLLIVAVPTVVMAAIAAVDTNDGAWDSNWGTPLRVDSISGPAGYDIDTFWVNTDAASPSVYYFGLTTVGSLANDAIVYFWIDCNDNDVFTDNADRIIEYDPLNDWVTEYSGDEILIELGPDPDPNGEVIGGNSVEVQTNNTGDVSWASCQGGNHSIKAEIWNDIITNVADSSPSQSGTVPRTYDLPTAVTLNSFAAKSTNPGLSYVAFSVLLLGIVAWTFKSIIGKKK